MQDYSVRRRGGRRRKRRTRFPQMIISTLILIMSTVAIYGFLNVGDKDYSQYGGAQALKTMASSTTDTPNFRDTEIADSLVKSSDVIPSEKTALIKDLEINSSNAILVLCGENNETLFEKEAAEKIFPASMTKIMTAIVALENIDDLSKKIVLDDSIFSPIRESNATIAGFWPGEEVSAIDLLYGLMLPSGAECAVGLAQASVGTEGAFVDLMNDKARYLGMEDTHFTNADGLHNEQHYSTARDIAVLLDYAIKNDVFYEIFTSVKHSTRPTNLHSGGITYQSTLFSKIDNTEFDGGSILGGKTGYTDEAGQCLASLAQKDGNIYILVTGGARGKGSMDRLHIDDAFTVYNAIH